MKFMDTYIVPQTQIKIGRKVQYRVVNGVTVERVSKSYTAEYKDQDGRRTFEGLGTSHKREAIRKAQFIHQQLHEGVKHVRPPTRLKMSTLIDRFLLFSESKNLASTTLAKYRSETQKLSAYCASANVEYAGAFTESCFYRYGQWLREQVHKQHGPYSPASLEASAVLCKMLFKWGRVQGLLREDPIANARVSKSSSAAQPCFTTEQVHGLLQRCKSLEHEADRKRDWRVTHDAIAILAFTGMRVGELQQLRWSDVLFDRGEHGVIRVCRGGSQGVPKDKDTRYVPIPEMLRPLIDQIPKEDILVLPTVRDRSLLGRVKELSRSLGYGGHWKTHSLRHHFVSMCASSGVPMRLTLAWVGHHSSEILNIYYTLHDQESEAAMRALSGRIRSQERS